MAAPVKIAIIDDYQSVALAMADWSPLKGRTEIAVFRDHIGEADALVARLAPFQVICVMRERTPFPRAIIERLPNLKLICSNGRRNAAIDVAAAKERGVIVCHTGYSSHGAAELAWALILGLVRNIPREANAVRGGRWQETVGGDLEGKTIGLLGFGNLGQRVGAVGRAFGMNAIAWSQNLTAEKAAAGGAKLVSKDELFRQADIVTVHLVLSARSRGLVGAHEFSLMKPTAYFVNTSRGPIVDEKALIATLEAREIAGAALDVFDVEPLPAGHKLRSLDNVVATGHVGFVTERTYRIFYGDTVENIAAWLDGKPIRVTEP